MEVKFLPLNFIPDNCTLLAPDDFSALIAGYAEALDKPETAASLIEQEVILDLIHKWLKILTTGEDCV